MLIDYHMHTTFSADSIVEPRQAIERAIEMGFEEITITDHMDILPAEIHDDTHILDAERYFPTLESLQKEYQSELTINIGVEVGLNPGVLDLCSNFVRSYPFDFVIASLHRLNCQSLRNQEYLQSFGGKAGLYCTYYQTLSELLDGFDDFDVCGHIDFIRRVMPYQYESDDYHIGREIVDNLLKKLIARGKGIEINTSGLRHYSHATIPHLPIVSRYHELGGEILTVGADSHRIPHVGYGLKEVIMMLPSLGITKLSTFKQRQVSFHQL